MLFSPSETGLSMVLCPPQIQPSPVLSDVPVTDFSVRNLGSNQQTYQQLKTALSLNLRRQIFIAVCDDLPLRDRLATQLQTELSHVKPAGNTRQATEPRAIPRLVTLELDLYDPNPIAQVAAWLNDLPALHTRRHALLPAFQILGIEQLTRQPAETQNIFLGYLQTLEQTLPLLECNLILWMTQPWFRLLPEAVPEFWQYHTGIFEFAGDPMPLPVTSPERIPPDFPASARRHSGRNPVEPAGADLPESTAPAAETANPWIPLADDLGLWYEDASPDAGQEPPRSQLRSNAGSLTGLDRLDADPGMVLMQSAMQTPEAASSPTAQPGDLLTPDSAAALSIAHQLLAVLQQESPLLSEADRSQRLEPTLTGELAISDPVLEGLKDPLTDPTVLENLPLLEQIGLLQQQIDSLQQSQNPATLATAYRTLGNFYRDCIEQGEGSAEHLTVAIQSYEQALQWLPDQTLEQAETLNDLGSLYWMVAQLQQGEAAVTCLQQTARLYQQALQGIDPDAQPEFYASLHNNLGATYADLARYADPCANLQQSIAAYRRVLQYRSAATDPIRYASTQNNLGTTYWNLAQQQQPELNLKQSIHAYSEALRYHDPQHEPLNYAMIQNNLGTAFWNLAQYEQPQLYLQQALTAYQDALQYRSLEAAPVGFAATQNNLGTAYWHLSHHTDGAEKQTCLRQAIAAYEATLQSVEVLGAEGVFALNFDLASTYHNLGLAYGEIALHRAVEPLADAQTILSADLDKSLHYHLLALQQWATYPDLRQAAFQGILQTLRSVYTHLGLVGQNQFLSQLPSDLLSEVLSRL